MGRVQKFLTRIETLFLLFGSNPINTSLKNFWWFSSFDRNRAKMGQNSGETKMWRNLQFSLKFASRVIRRILESVKLSSNRIGIRPMPNVYTSGWMWFARYYFAQSLKSTFFDNFSSLPLGAILFNFFRFLALFKADSFNHLTTTRFLLGLRHSTVKHGHKNSLSQFKFFS